jgi:hypothetical protein
MENTTNINELPIETTPPENRNLPEGQINSSMNRMIDPNATIREEKHVRFQEVLPVNKESASERLYLATSTFLVAPALNPDIPLVGTLLSPISPSGDPPNIAIDYIDFYIYIKYMQSLLLIISDNLRIGKFR